MCSFMLDQVSHVTMLSTSVSFLVQVSRLICSGLVKSPGHMTPGISRFISWPFFRMDLGCLDISSYLQCAVFKEQDPFGSD